MIRQVEISVTHSAFNDRSVERRGDTTFKTPSRIEVLISWKRVCNSWRDSRLGFAAIAYQFEAHRPLLPRASRKVVQARSRVRTCMRANHNRANCL